MKTFSTLALFTFAVSSAYTGVAFLLPQLESRPPPRVRLGAKIEPDALAVLGAEVFAANCSQCHKFGESVRAPDLATIGSEAPGRAAERARQLGAPFTDVDYLVEALCKPGDYLVEGYGNIMPPQGKALSGGQLQAVTAFLQTLGGEATLQGTDVSAIERFGCLLQPAAGGPSGSGPAAAPEPLGPPEQIFVKFGCGTCHAIDAPAGGSNKGGPNLGDVGRRLSKGELYDSLLAPDAVVAEGFGPGIMKNILESNGFYRSMTPAAYKALVDWLAEHGRARR